MSVFDFIRESYLGTGAMLAANWPLLIVFALILILAGWLWTIANSEQDDEPAPDTLSPAQKDALRAWALRQKMPPNAPEMVELAQEWLALCRSESSTRPEHDESY